MRLGPWLCLFVAACGDDDGHHGGGDGLRLKANLGLDLSRISGFAISGSATSPRAIGTAPHADGDQTLYAIDVDGNLIVTTVIDDPSGDGGSTTSTQTAPRRVYDTPKHVLITYTGLAIGGGAMMQQNCGGVIVRKSDGALFCYPGQHPRHATPNSHGGGTKSDGADLLYLHGGDNFNDGAIGAMTRVDMATSPPEISQIVDEAVQTFDVNRDGDALVSLSLLGTSSLRVTKSSGGLQNLLANRSYGQWVAPNGHDFYYLSAVGSVPNTSFDVHLATRQGDASYVVSSAGTLQRLDGDDAKIVLVTATAAYGFVSAQNMPRLTELLGPSQGTAQDLRTLTGLAGITDVSGAATSIFVQGTDGAGNGGIVRVDVPAFTTTTILPPGAFTLSAISPSKTGDLSFAGLRNSDGAKVLGFVAAGSDTFTITSVNAPTVTQLVRIN